MRQRDQRGSIAPAIPVIGMILLLLGGLTIDGSRQLNARGAATAYAEEAARAGAQGIDSTEFDLVLDEALVRDRVAEYCRAIQATGPVTSCRLVGIEEVSSDDNRRLVVATEVRTRINTTLLGMVGKQTLTATGTGRARPYEGIDTPLEP